MTSRGSGVAVTHSLTGDPILALADRDADGRVDFLTYAVLDETGKRRLDLTDYDADGQWDLRIHRSERDVEIWHIDRWYRIEMRDDQRGIVIDGRFVVLEQRNNRWIVP